MRYRLYISAWILPVSPSIGLPLNASSEYSRGSTVLIGSSGAGISSKALYITPSSSFGASFVKRSPISSNALDAFSLMCSAARPTRSPIAPLTFLGVTPCIMAAGKKTSSHAFVGFIAIFFANSPGSSIKRSTGFAIGSTITFLAVATNLFPKIPSGAVPSFSAVSLALYISTVSLAIVGAASTPAAIRTCGGTYGVIARYPAGLPTAAL